MQKILLIFVLGALGFFNHASADIITNEQFILGTNGATAVGDTLQFSRMFTAADGVSFTATLNVVGSADINQTANVMGIVGNSSNLFNSSEFAEFSMVLSAVTGGTVVFDGFSQIDLDAFEGTEQAAVSVDSTFDAGTDQILTAGTVSDEFTLANLNSFFLVGDGSSAFRARDVSAGFTTAAAVPEPSTFTAVGLLLAGLAWKRNKTTRKEQEL